MKNKLTDLNNILFEQIERINQDDLTAEETDTVIKKAESIGKIAETIVKNNEFQFKVALKASEYNLISEKTMEKLISIKVQNG